MSNLPTLFKVNFRDCSPVPLLLQDVFGGIINDHIIISCGCAAQVGQGKARHFSYATWAVNRSDLLLEWDRKKEGKGGSGSLNIKYIKLPDFPGSGRQKGSSLVIDDQILLCWGGFSYYPCKKFTPDILKLPKKYPVGYSDGYALLSDGGKWVWKKLPNLPEFVHSGATLTRIGDWIYLYGGCEYHQSSFHTFHDHAGENVNLGSRLYRMRVDILKKYLSGGDGSEIPVWERLVDCPGTPRMNHVGIEVNGRLFVQGGISGRPFGGEFYSTVDNWCYDPTQNKWSEIAKCPSSNTNWQSAIQAQNQYILLVGGAHTFNRGGTNEPRKVVDRDHNVTDGYGRMRHHSGVDRKGLMSADILVYDVVNNSYGHMDGTDPKFLNSGDNTILPLPRELNNPLVVELRPGLIGVICGEIEMNQRERSLLGGGLRTHLSNIFIVGEISK